MLMSYEDTFSNFPNRKSNKTILIIKDVAIYSFQSYLHHIIFPFPPDRSWWSPSKLVVWIESETTSGAIGPKLFSDFIG